MSQARNRWIVNVVLVVAVIAFVGISMVPLLTGFVQSQSTKPGNTTNPTSTPVPTNEKSKLEDQARGYESVLQREPEKKVALQGLLEARLQLLRLGQGNIKGVIEPLEKLAKLNPEKTEYTILLAQAKQQIGEPEAAAAAYRSILQTKPGDIKALQGLVVLLLQQKRPEAAIGLLQDTLTNSTQANKIQPGSVDTTSVKLLLAQVYVTQKRSSDAISLYDQLIKNDKQDFRPLLAKAIVIKDQGKTEEAKPLFDQAAALAPANVKDKINQLATSQLTPSTAPSTAPSAGGKETKD